VAILICGFKLYFTYKKNKIENIIAESQKKAIEEGQIKSIAKEKKIERKKMEPVEKEKEVVEKRPLKSHEQSYRFFNFQKIICLIGFISITGVVFYPTWRLKYQGVTVYKRAFLYSSEKLLQINYSQMAVEVLYIIFICGFLIYFFDKKTN